MAASISIDEICSRVASRREGLTALIDRYGYVPFLPALELPYEHVNVRLIPALIAAGIDRSDAESVSLRTLVLFALTADISTWVSNAISWIENGFPMDDDVALALEDVGNDKRYQQKTRQRALYLSKRWRHASQ